MTQSPEQERALPTLDKARGTLEIARTYARDRDEASADAQTKTAGMKEVALFRAANYAALLGQNTVMLAEQVVALLEEREARCPSCEHEVKIHSDDGCWHGVGIGRLNKSINCPCAVSRESLEARP